MKTCFRILAKIGLVTVVFAGWAAAVRAEGVLRTDRLYVVGLPARAEIDLAAAPVAEPVASIGQTGFVIVPAPVVAEAALSESAAAKASPTHAPAESLDRSVERPAAESTSDVAS